MPPRKSPKTYALTALAEHLKNARKPVNHREWTENDIVNHIRIGQDVTLTPVRKLIKAALRNKCLELVIGIPPGSPRGEDENPLAPTYFYEGPDVMKLEPLLTSRNKLLNCSATLCYGDGGNSVETDEEAAHAYKVIEDNYREPSLCLYF